MTNQAPADKITVEGAASADERATYERLLKRFYPSFVGKTAVLDEAESQKGVLTFGCEGAFLHLTSAHMAKA
jgi:hypothetical protein